MPGTWLTAKLDAATQVNELDAGLGAVLTDLDTQVVPFNVTVPPSTLMQP